VADAVALTPGFTVTTVEDIVEQPDAVTVTLYVPAAAKVAEAMTGFWSLDEKLFGPVQEKVVPMSVKTDRSSGEPTHTGLLLPAVAVGLALMVIAKGAVLLLQGPQYAQVTVHITSQFPAGRPLVF